MRQHLYITPDLASHQSNSITTQTSLHSETTHLSAPMLKRQGMRKNKQSLYLHWPSKSLHLMSGQCLAEGTQNQSFTLMIKLMNQISTATSPGHVLATLKQQRPFVFTSSGLNWPWKLKREYWGKKKQTPTILLKLM